jgi:hypothetical protein
LAYVPQLLNTKLLQLQNWHKLRLFQAKDSYGIIGPACGIEIPSIGADCDRINLSQPIYNNNTAISLRLSLQTGRAKDIE